MRNVILFMVTSLDGYICGPNGELDWENRDPEVGGALIPELLATVDTMILGRVLYEGFHQFWPGVAADPNSPKELVDFAHWVAKTKKLVFSKTLDSADWTASKLVKVHSDADIVMAINELKGQPGGDIVLFGGARFARTCVKLGLIDEYRFKEQAVALGDGQPLFGSDAKRTHLSLIRSRDFQCGVVAKYYRSVP